MIRQSLFNEKFKPSTFREKLFGKQPVPYECLILFSLMDGIVESARCADSTVASCSVACVVALLGSLEDLSQGRGLSDEHIEFLSKMKETDNWDLLKEYDNAASAREMGNSVNGEGSGYRRGNRWELDSQGSPDGDIESLTERFEKDGGAWDNLTDGEIRYDGTLPYLPMNDVFFNFPQLYFYFHDPSKKKL